MFILYKNRLRQNRILKVMMDLRMKMKMKMKMIGNVGQIIIILHEDDLQFLVRHRLRQFPITTTTIRIIFRHYHHHHHYNEMDQENV